MIIFKHITLINFLQVLLNYKKKFGFFTKSLNMIKKNTDLKTFHLVKVSFYMLILSIIYSCNSEVNINSVNQNQLNKETDSDLHY